MQGSLPTNPAVMEADEIMGALEPVNDNGLPLSKVG
jgi:hypothetical protein